jgi:hypothetical protein
LHREDTQERFISPFRCIKKKEETKWEIRTYFAKSDWIQAGDNPVIPSQPLIPAQCARKNFLGVDGLGEKVLVGARGVQRVVW